MKCPGLFIRRAGPQDYDGIVSLWTRAGLEHRPTGRDSRHNLEREMADPEADILLAMVGERIVGTVIGTNDGRKGWVNRLAVDPDHRGKGVAQALVAEVEACFRDRSIGVFSCLVMADNDPSQRLFEGIGYDRHPEVIYYSKKTGPGI
jgi:N-acetylglutamate synthase